MALPRPATVPSDGVLRTQGRVIHALVLREMRTRFGRQRLGFLWAVMEPVILVALLVGVKNIAGLNSPLGMAPVPFFFTGILCFYMYRNALSRTASAVSGNRGLLLYPQVTPLDTVVARLLLEIATMTTVLTIISVATAMLGLGPLPAEPLQLFGVMLLAAFIGMPVGLMVGALQPQFPTIDRVVAPSQRVLLFISGAFFVPAMIPTGAREIMLWNPLFHVTEAARAAYFHDFERIYGSIGYVIAWILPLLLIGLIAERMARRVVVRW